MYITCNLLSFSLISEMQGRIDAKVPYLLPIFSLPPSVKCIFRNRQNKGFYVSLLETKNTRILYNLL